MTNDCLTGKEVIGVASAQQHPQRYEESILLPRVAAVMRETLAGPVRLGFDRSLSDPDRRNALLRYRVLDAPAAAPRSVVVKCANQERYLPDDPGCWAARGLFRDWAGLRLLTEVVGGQASGAPRFYGGDRATGFVVMEDLGECEDLAHVLCCSTRSRAEAALEGLASGLGGMHAATAAAGLARRYDAIREDLGPGDRGMRENEARDIQAAVPRIARACATLGVEAGAGFERDVAALAQAMAEPGPFLAYTTGDPCLDNALQGPDARVRLHDFEFGAFRHALRDGVYGQMRFPTCWCVRDVPPAVVERMDRAYRESLARGCPAAGDDRLYRTAVAEACGAWLITTLGHLLERSLACDGVWGVATLRQRIVRRLRTFAAAAEEGRCLHDLRGVSLRLYDVLAARWGDTLPVYGAFTRENEPPPERVAALFAAVEAGDAAITHARAADDGQLVNAYGSRWVQPLYRAVECGQAEVARALLEAGADPDAATPSGRTALATACGAARPAVVAALLEHGADPNAADLSGQTPVHFAARAGRPDIVARLRTAGARVDAAAAVLLGNLPDLETAVHGDPGALGRPLIDGDTLLHLAASGEGGEAAVRWLLARRVDLEARTPSGWTPLHAAAANGHNRAADILLAHGAAVDATTEAAETPLHLACGRGHAATVGLLLDRGADINRRDRDGATPLCAAAGAGHASVVEQLLDRGADPDAIDRFGRTALARALAARHAACVDVLKGRGAKAVGEGPGQGAGAGCDP